MPKVTSKKLSKIENLFESELERLPVSRAKDFATFLEDGLPNGRLEGWRWSDFESALQAENVDLLSAVDPFKDSDAIRFNLTNFSMANKNHAKENLKFNLVEDFDQINGAGCSSLIALTKALSTTAGKPSALSIEVLGQIEVPLHLVFASSGNRANFNRIKISVRPGSSVKLIESHLGGSQLSSTILEIDVNEGGSLTRTVYQSGSDQQVQFVYADVRLQDNSSFVQAALAFGSKVSRLETNLVYQGEHAESKIMAAYVIGEGKHVDFTTVVNHSAQHCKTDQLTKGAVKNGGRGVFQGKFLVPKDVGQYSDATMQHHALLLGDRAEVFAKPELEIYADDVACAHGNTSGCLDPNQLFYLRQRGIPEPLAKTMMTEAFISETFNNIPDTNKHILLALVKDGL